MYMKKFAIILGMVLCIAIGLFAIYRWQLSVTPDDGSALRENIEYLNEEVDLALIVYGEEIDFPEVLEYETIDSLEKINWQKENQYVYLIINDLNGTVNFEKENYLELVEYANMNTNFNFYYIGTNALSVINENTQDANINSTDMSFGYVIYEGTRLQHLGVWSQNDHQYLGINPNLLGENIMDAVLTNIQSNE